MIQHLGQLAVVESEVERHRGREADDAGEHQQPRIVTVAVRVERVVANLVTIWLIVRVRLVNDAVGVGIGRENVLVTVFGQNDGYLLEHREDVQVSELVVDLGHGIFRPGHAGEDDKSLIDRCDELVVERRRVHVGLVLGRLLGKRRKTVGRLVFVPLRARGGSEVSRLLRAQEFLGGSAQHY